MRDEKLNDTYNTDNKHKKICWNCSGTKKSLGGGMLKIDCPVCVDVEDRKTFNLDRRSRSYKDAHKALVKDCGLSSEEAHNKLNAKE